MKKPETIILNAMSHLCDGALVRDPIAFEFLSARLFDVLVQQVSNEARVNKRNCKPA